MIRVVAGAAAMTLGVFGTLKARQIFDKTKNNDLYALDPENAQVIGETQSPLPSRSEILDTLKITPEFDVLVIGGGATGTGVALDAVTRGFNTALVEKYDYSSGSSSRSTKLIHGGVRYLQKAIFNLDINEYKMVKEALQERASMLKKAPHLSGALPIMLPVYKWWQVPYFWAGIKMYDLVAGKQLVKSSYFVGREKALELFPMLKAKNLCGAIIYYDGQHDDARMNLAIAVTAIRRGAVASNHVEVLNILTKKVEDENKQPKEVVCGAHVRDRMTGDEWDIHAKSVVNATGPFTDQIRKMADPNVKSICQASSGVHIVLPEYYSPKNMGLLDPATSDGRVIFFLPWEGKTIAGTTDTPCDVTFSPSPSEKEIQFILNEIKNYLNPDIHVRRGDVLAAWSGIRPLVSDPASTHTKTISRSHVIEISDKNMITIAGGKWTTYRSMAADTVDAVVKNCSDLPSSAGCQTEDLILEGGEGWTPTAFIRLVQDFGLEPEVAKHLSQSYGNKAPQVAKLAKLTGKRWPVVGDRLVDEFPFIEAEVFYGIKEYALTAVDMIARRLRISFLNAQAAQEILPKVVEIMGNELGWNEAKREEELRLAREFLDDMGLLTRLKSQDVPSNFSHEEKERYFKVFERFDVDKSGHLTVSSLRKVLEDLGKTDITDAQLRGVISEVDLDFSSTVDFEEFLKLMSAIKTGVVANSRLGTLVSKHYDHLLEPISTERSGGGL